MPAEPDHNRTDAADSAAKESAAEQERHESTLAQPPETSPPGVPSDQLPTEAHSESDVQLAPDNTIVAPSFRSPASPKSSGGGSATALEAGDRIDDFEVEQVLGRGAFGVVYLAQQLSLDRRIALKVAANEGSEGRTMARLEHDHIVQVFSETVDPTGALRLLCMQLVPGASLEGVIHNLHRREPNRPEWNGNDYLAVVESRTVVTDVLDTNALHDRELLAGYDAVQAAAWIGARLAEAVDYAHKQGVLHRDIKPANVLVNQYGRPMLADFNISFRSFDNGSTPDSTFGGTLAFMAPEHVDAFNPMSGASPEDVDQQSDVYSLGIVVYELLTGGRPFDDPKRNDQRTTFLQRLSDSRRASPPPLDDSPPSARKTLVRTIAKSLEGEKRDRWASGAEFATALDGARDLRTAERQLPDNSHFAQGAWRWPFVWLVLLAVGPQIIGSVVNISYNLFEIVGKLSPAQEQLFLYRLVPIYNAVVYPLLIAIGVWAVSPVYKTWRRLASNQRVDKQEADRARRRAINLPLWMLGIAAAGWLPGGVIFPVMLDRLLDEPVSGSVYAHFATSFALSGLIAVAYSFCGLQFLALRVFYPRMWVDASQFSSRANDELRSVPRRLWLIDFLSTAIPSVAMAMFLVPPLVFLWREGQQEYSFRVVELALLVALLGLGLFGREITTRATSRMTKAYTALTGGSR